MTENNLDQIDMEYVSEIVVRGMYYGNVKYKNILFNLLKQEGQNMVEFFCEFSR